MNAEPEATKPRIWLARESVCRIDAAGHCPTCADEALLATVLSVEQDASLARVSLGESEAVVDISLVGAVMPGETLLVHGGVALERLEETGGSL
jgi:hydrogenase maturation factor